AFRAFTGTLPSDGLLVASADDRGAATLAAQHGQAGAAVATFGTDPGADVWLSEVAAHTMTATAHLTWQRDLVSPTGVVVPAGTTRTLTVPMPGVHNLRNAAAALVAATAGLG